jgi:hypothetical protein
MPAAAPRGSRASGRSIRATFSQGEGCTSINTERNLGTAHAPAVRRTIERRRSVHLAILENEMRTRACIVILGVLLLAAPAYAADVDGKWAGAMETPMGEVTLTFNLKAEGDTLTGSMMGPDGTEIQIANGKIEGNKISYTVTVDFGGMQLEMIYRGIVTPAEITLDLEIFGMPFGLVVKKVN